jgi:hypothetical protein
MQCTLTIGLRNSTDTNAANTNTQPAANTRRYDASAWGSAALANRFEEQNAVQPSLRVRPS